MTDKLLLLLRGIVRPVTTLAVVFVLVWGFVFVIIYKPLPAEIYVKIIEGVLTVAGMVLAFWFGGRTVGKT